MTGRGGPSGASGRVVVGVDGGGTKTDVVVATASGEVLVRCRVGRTNHESIGLEAAVHELGRGVAEALAEAEVSPADVAASVFGLAGVDWPSDETVLGAAVDGFGLAGRRLVCNDSALALRAGAASGWGIVSSIGTGAVTAGVDAAGRRFRTMSVGWGEPCGAVSLSHDALHAVAAAYHRTAPATVLTEWVPDDLGVGGVAELFEALSRQRLAVGGRLAPLVQRAAVEGDEVAVGIVERSAVAHAAMVVGVAEHLDLVDASFELVTSGGVHDAGGPFAERFAAGVAARCPHAVIVPLRRPPVDGAVLLALDLLGRAAG